MEEVWRCAQCGNVIGVYEPLVIVEDNGARTTARAKPPAQPNLNSCASRACSTTIALATTLQPRRRG